MVCKGLMFDATAKMLERPIMKQVVCKKEKGAKLFKACAVDKVSLCTKQGGCPDTDTQKNAQQMELAVHF